MTCLLALTVLKNEHAYLRKIYFPGDKMVLENMSSIPFARSPVGIITSTAALAFFVNDCRT